MAEFMAVYGIWFTWLSWFTSTHCEEFLLFRSKLILRTVSLEPMAPDVLEVGAGRDQLQR